MPTVDAADMSRACIAVISTVHDTYDTRIFYKQLSTLRSDFHVTYFSPVSGNTDEDWIVPLHKARSKFGRLLTHVSLLRSLFDAKFDLYLLHDPELLPLGLVLAALGKKVVWDMHEDTYNDIKTKTYLPKVIRGPAALIYGLFQRTAYRCFAGFILAEDEYGRYFPRSRKTCVVHNYPLLDHLAAQPPVMKRPNTIVYIGSISPNRGIYELVDVAARLSGRLSDFKLVLIGPFVDDALENDVRRKINEKGIAEAVEIRGPIRNLEAYPALAECMVGVALLLPEPNFTRSLPTKMFEYMALGLPVAVSNFPLWESIVTRSAGGVSMDPRDTNGVADAIYEILTDRARYSTLSENAREAARRYSWATEGAALKRFLSGLLTA